MGIAGSSVAMTPPADAGDTGWIPDPGRSHAEEQLSLVTTAEPAPWSPGAVTAEPLCCKHGAQRLRLLKPVCPRAPALHGEAAATRGRRPGD